MSGFVIPKRNGIPLPPLQTAGVTATQTYERRERDGTKTVLKEKFADDRLEPAKEEQAARVSIALGATLPGPELSFMSARVDVSCSLPCGTSDAAIKAAFERASTLVQERLELEGAEVQEEFDKLPKKYPFRQSS